MCLAIPVKILKIKGNTAIADFWGIQKQIDVRLVADVRVGDYVLVHAGFAIEKINKTQARKNLELLKNISYE
ncbi:MAG: HypC/HybG/HupF family hydrogenase formation chaperone [Candidatus Omnitrophica bacterium]|nr:HypC/HybG/HupF family hydrogenase formation chaperone [Candidatus Omnitrophota bacterium]